MNFENEPTNYTVNKKAVSGVHLSRQQSLSRPLSAAGSAKDNNEPFLKGARFLLVENDEQVADAMCALLSDWGANTSLIASVTDASSMPGQHFDALIADYHLDYGETGFDVAARLAENSVSFDVKILVTANRSNDIREEAAEQQFSYLPKPLKPAALKRLLKQSLS